MNIVRFNSVYEGLSAVAKKVYSAVPIEAAWTLQQIKSEADRLNLGITQDHRVFGGCLNSLIQSGLVRESPKGSFRRIKVSSKPEEMAPCPKPIEQPEPKQMQQATPKTKSAISTIDRLAVLAKQLMTLASELETAALEIEEQNAINAEGRKKLEQLQALLKGVA